jgi:hypothetical protein
MARWASLKLLKFVSQTHSSLRLRKKRSMTPFCSGVYGVMYSCLIPYSRHAFRNR